MVFVHINLKTFRVYKVCLKLFGVWPLDNHQGWSTLVFSVTLLAQIASVSMCLMHPLDKCLPAEFRNAHRTRILATILAVLHQICLRIWGPWMVPLIEAAMEDWLSIKDKKSIDIMRRHTKYGSFLAWAQTIVLFGLLPIGHLRSLPLITKFEDKTQICVLDSIWTNAIPVLSWITYFVCKISSSIGFMLFWTFAMHLSGQYKILKEQFQDFLLIKDRKVSRKEFRRLVERHNRLIGLTGSLEDSFTVFVAIHLLVLQICCGLIVLQQIAVIDGLKNLPTVARSPVMTFIVTVLYMYYCAGDYLTACSEEIGDVFNQCNWYDLSKGSITSFSIIIARSQTPKSLTAIRMYKLNLSNFKDVVNALYSYISCMAAVIEVKSSKG